MKSVLVFLSLTIGTNAFAGTGGYVTTNCQSASGRTMVSVYQGDFETGVTVLVDGKVSQYIFNDFSPAGDSVTVKANTLTVKIKNAVQVSLAGQGEKRELTIQPGADPRTGTDIHYVAKKELIKVPVTCKSYAKEP